MIFMFFFWFYFVYLPALPFHLGRPSNNKLIWHGLIMSSQFLWIGLAPESKLGDKDESPNTTSPTPHTTSLHLTPHTLHHTILTFPPTTSAHAPHTLHTFSPSTSTHTTLPHITSAHTTPLISNPTLWYV